MTDAFRNRRWGEAGDGGGTLAVKEQYSATGEKVPKKTADAPLMALAGRSDTGGRRSEGVVEVGRVCVGGSGGFMLFTAAVLLLSNKFTEMASENMLFVITNTLLFL